VKGQSPGRGGGQREGGRIANNISEDEVLKAQFNGIIRSFWGGRKSLDLNLRKWERWMWSRGRQGRGPYKVPKGFQHHWQRKDERKKIPSKRPGRRRDKGRNI